ncbi:tetraacyldisaccharide 4'-kinase [Pseudoalteromonas pernae]|uniref:tetraacyldisaccharide 4'-kinase n=1 Tax=Pseudoalteromonas pernae TaxID=3118054 RepID=UPI003242AE79
MSNTQGGFAKRLEASWFEPFGLLSAVMLPLSGIFWLLSAFNRLLFRVGIKKAYHSPVPVIVIGNISVGGNGKTPMVIYLADLLKTKGKRVGIISRGYGSQPPSTPFSVTADTPTDVGGDEPVLLAKRTGCPVVIGGDRKASIEYLMSEHQIDVILSDDGLQHYALGRDIELCIVDAKRGHGNGLLIPAGPLREGTWRLNSVDLIVYNGEQANECAYQLEATGLFQVANEQPLAPPFKAGVALSAIGNPQRFYDSLLAHQVLVTKTYHFRDHHKFVPEDIPSVEVVYMTEKDAVKCSAFAHEQCYYLRVDAKPNEQLEQQLTKLLKDKGVL